MKALLYQLDGKIPNIALMRIAAHHRAMGHDVELGAWPYPMPYVRTPELIGFQRWVIGAYDKRIPWSDWVAAHYQPRRLPWSA